MDLLTNFDWDHYFPTWCQNSQNSSHQAAGVEWQNRQANPPPHPWQSAVVLRVYPLIVKTKKDQQGRKVLQGIVHKPGAPQIEPNNLSVDLPNTGPTNFLFTPWLLDQLNVVAAGQKYSAAGFGHRGRLAGLNPWQNLCQQQGLLQEAEAAACGWPWIGNHPPGLLWRFAQAPPQPPNHPFPPPLVPPGPGFHPNFNINAMTLQPVSQVRPYTFLAVPIKDLCQQDPLPWNPDHCLLKGDLLYLEAVHEAAQDAVTNAINQYFAMNLGAVLP